MPALLSMAGIQRKLRLLGKVPLLLLSSDVEIKRHNPRTKPFSNPYHKLNNFSVDNSVYTCLGLDDL